VDEEGPADEDADRLLKATSTPADEEGPVDEEGPADEDADRLLKATSTPADEEGPADKEGPADEDADRLLKATSTPADEEGPADKELFICMVSVGTSMIQLQQLLLSMTIFLAHYLLYTVVYMRHPLPNQITVFGHLLNKNTTKLELPTRPFAMKLCSC